MIHLVPPEMAANLLEADLDEYKTGEALEWAFHLSETQRLLQPPKIIQDNFTMLFLSYRCKLICC